jgi:glycosyltransferase involved in cell wall biosynthesis
VSIDPGPLNPQRPRVRVVCLPDVDRPIGGVKQLYRHVEHLQAQGWDAKVLTQNSGFKPGWFTSSASTAALRESHKAGELDPTSTILVLPETYVNANLSSFEGVDLSGFARVILNQNAYYSYGQFDAGTAARVHAFYRQEAVLQILSISEDTHSFLSTNIGVPDGMLSRIINAIEPGFNPNQPKRNIVHWLPRKNQDHSQAVLTALASRSSGDLRNWSAEPVGGISHEQMAAKLNGARLFLAFGHPEGFGLPIAEAMASGCWVVGYSGGGGRELFGFGASEAIAFGDWTHFVSATLKAVRCFREQPRETELRVRRQALAIRSLYDSLQEGESIRTAWDRIAAAWQRWLQR